MTGRTHSMIGAAAVIAALALPAAAGASGGSVRVHTDRAEAALDRAVTLLERGADRRAAAKLRRSRSELGRAASKAAKLSRTADSPSELRRAASAQALVGERRDENVEVLVGALGVADGRVERRIANAALQDTRGREKAIAVIAAILQEGVPAPAAERLSTALARLSGDRSEEVETEAEALAGDDVSAAGKRTLARAVEENVEGQAAAAAHLSELLADAGMPEAAKAGLQTAYDAVTADHASVADILSRFSERMPATVRSFVEQVVARARTDAQSMAEQRPAPPAGAPESAPNETAGPPEGTPGAGAQRRP